MKILVRFVACLLYCLGSIAPLHAIEATHSPNIKHNDAIHTFDALIQMIKTPTNVTELLHNIKFAVDHEL